ncbi:MAG: KTSC domain-containing protein [Leptolyngbyaceae cyanobacterium SL_5_14]|nr:KTSC domain-containing protein [Leptolyngbyaceae cyanobacterium SL_5_14]
MDMQSVSSSAISEVGYDESTQQMKIKFKQGKIYDFCQVPEYIFQGLLAASSKGAYYNSYIKDKYPC